MVKEHLEKRLNQFKAEYETKQQTLAELEAKLSKVQEALLHLDNAVKAIEELLDPAVEPLLCVTRSGFKVCAKNRQVGKCGYEQVIIDRQPFVYNGELVIVGQLIRDSGDRQLNEDIQIVVDDEVVFTSEKDRVGIEPTQSFFILQKTEVGHHTVTVRHANTDAHPKGPGSVEVNIEVVFIPTPDDHPLQRTWSPEVIARNTIGIDEPDGQYISLNLDSEGQAHISYWAGEPPSRLMYAHKDAGTWNISEVEQTRGAQSSIAVDSQGQPHISYYDLDASALKLAHWDGNQWQTETVADGLTDAASGAINLALTSLDKAYISYWDNNNLFLADFNGQAWQSIAVGSAGTTIGNYHALVLQQQKFPYVAYFDVDQKSLNLARWSAVTGRLSTFTTVEAGGGDYINLVLDSNGNPHLTFLTQTELKYAHYNGTEWIAEIVDSGEGVGLYASLVLTSDNRPFVSYYNANTGDLMFAHQMGTDWITETVDSEGDVGGYASLALDEHDVPHLAYYDWSNGALKFARLNTNPQTMDRRFETLINTPLSGNLLSDQIDLEQDTLTLTPKPVVEPAYGQVNLQEAGEFTYIPKEGFIGTDYFRYEVCDEGGLCQTSVAVISVEVPVIELAQETIKQRRRSIRVTLQLDNSPPKLYTRVQREESDGVWQNVDRWRGRLWKGRQKTIRVGKDQLGDCPYRWAFYSDRNGYLLGYSRPFYLPDQAGELLILSGTLVPSTWK